MSILALIFLIVAAGSTCYVPVSGSAYNQRATWHYKSKTPTHLLNRARAYIGDDSRMVAFMAKAVKGTSLRCGTTCNPAWGWFMNTYSLVCDLGFFLIQQESM